MDKFFNTAGPCQPDLHYVLPPLARVNLVELETLIAARKYFVLHAPRQTGKTTALLALRDHLNAQGRYRAVYANVEMGQSARNDVGAAMQAILGEIARRYADAFGEAARWTETRHALERGGPHGALNAFLEWLAQHSPLPLVLMLDEVDALVGDTLISLLRQIRAGYDRRPAGFPQTVVLCGVRDVRDYRLRTGGGEVITGGSAFNIKAESLRLGNFSPAEVKALYALHTEATGQAFVPEALELAWELTRGQPWLVNALGFEACFRHPAGQDRSQPVTADLLDTAAENLILRRDTHLDQLADKLREDRVRRVIQPMLTTGDLGQVPDDDLQYVEDLGLIRRGPQGPELANAIYREVVPRQLTAILQVNFEPIQQPEWYIGTDGRLELGKLLRAFQEFFRENSEVWLERFHYREAGPHLLLQAFLQRIVNGGGRIDREYALGRRRVDLLVRWPWRAADGQREQRAVIELKVVHRSREATILEGLAQTADYAERCAADEAHLVVFDRRPEVSWDEKVFRDKREPAGRDIEVWGM